MRRHLEPLLGPELLELSAVSTPGLGRGIRGVARTDGGLRPLTELGVARIDRTLSVRPRRCSFSSLVASGHAAATTLDPTVGDRGADDEGDDAGATVGDDILEGRGTFGPADLDAADLDAADFDVAAREGHTVEAGPTTAADRFGGLRGTSFGSAVHEALEVALRRDEGVAFDDAASTALADALHRHAIPVAHGATEGLLAAASVRIAGATSLRALARDDVATELRFSMPVAAGVNLAAVARTLAANDRDGPFAAWADSLEATSGRRPLAAALVGSIDLVTTLGTGARYHVVDYKTNVLGTTVGGSSVHDAMVASDYPLQAVLYLVALHRYLRWRLAGYDPAAHLGEAHYLFLRHMREGADDGVCTWSPGHGAVVALSDLLAGTP